MDGSQKPQVLIPKAATPTNTTAEPDSLTARAIAIGNDVVGDYMVISQSTVSGAAVASMPHDQHPSRATNANRAFSAARLK